MLNDREERLDRMFADERRERRARRRMWLEERPCELSVVQREPPAVAVRTGLAAATRQTREREHDIGRDIALHPEQLAHGRRD
jgi:hypothetical protein